MTIPDDVIKWKYFPRYWPFVRGIHRSPVNSPHKGQWRGALRFSMICAWKKLLSKQSWGWWFETLGRSLWRHINDKTKNDAARYTLTPVHEKSILLYGCTCMHTLVCRRKQRHCNTVKTTNKRLHSVVMYGLVLDCALNGTFTVVRHSVGPPGLWEWPMNFISVIIELLEFY